MKKKNTVIIAEAGVNHNGRLAIAKKLVDAAKNAGADIVKFQTFLAENIVIKSIGIEYCSIAISFSRIISCPSILE